MTEDKKPKAIRGDSDFFSNFMHYIKLILRLMGDRRVNPLLKILPIASLIYLVIPNPIPPDLLPTPIDDALLIWLGSYLFIELCPTDVVQEHMQALNMVVTGDLREPAEEDQDEIIDAEFREES